MEQTRQLHGWRLAFGKRDGKDNMRIVASLRAATFDFRQFSTKHVSYRCLFGFCSCVMPLFFWNVLFKRRGIFYSCIGSIIRGGVSMDPVSRRSVLAAAAGRHGRNRRRRGQGRERSAIPTSRRRARSTPPAIRRA